MKKKAPAKWCENIRKSNTLFFGWMEINLFFHRTVTGKVHGYINRLVFFCCCHFGVSFSVHIVCVYVCFDIDSVVRYKTVMEIGITHYAFVSLGIRKGGNILALVFTEILHFWLYQRLSEAQFIRRQNKWRVDEMHKYILQFTQENSRR